jgi:hypothetical protein
MTGSAGARESQSKFGVVIRPKWVVELFSFTLRLEN